MAVSIGSLALCWTQLYCIHVTDMYAWNIRKIFLYIKSRWWIRDKRICVFSKLVEWIIYYQLFTRLFIIVVPIQTDITLFTLFLYTHTQIQREVLQKISQSLHKRCAIFLIRKVVSLKSCLVACFFGFILFYILMWNHFYYHIRSKQLAYYWCDVIAFVIHCCF